MGRLWNAYQSATDRVSTTLQPLGRRLDPVIDSWMRTIAGTLSSDERNYTYDAKTRTFYVSGEVQDEYEDERDIGQFEGVVTMLGLIFVLFPTALLSFVTSPAVKAALAVIVLVVGFAWLGRVQDLRSEENAFELEVIR